MEPNPEFRPATGDLIFLDLDCFAGCDAIETVKPGFRGARISHVGIFLEVDGTPYLIEAFPPEVRLTPLRVYLRRSLDPERRPRACVGRLKPGYRDLIHPAISHALSLRKLPYDRVYLTGEDEYYCSELVVDAFKYANGGEELFPEEPMSFRDPTTGEILDYWKRYYAYFGRPVPDGEPGSHPASLSLSAPLDIVARYGSMTGWN